MQRDSYQQSGAEQLAVGLGWFSIGLGLAELTAPDAVARFIGLRDDSTHHVRAARVRRARSRQWPRHPDATRQPDLAVVPGRRRRARSRLPRVGCAARGCRSRARRRGRGCRPRRHRARRDLRPAAERRRRSSATSGLASRSQAVHVERVTTVSRPIEDVYQFWKNFENFPRFMRHLESVTGHWQPPLALARHGPCRHARRVGGRNHPRRRKRVDRVAISRGIRRPEQRFGALHAGAGRARHGSSRAAPVHAPRPAPSDAASPGCSAKSRTSRSTKTCTGSSSCMETGEIPLSEGPGLWRAAQPPADPNRSGRSRGCVDEGELLDGHEERPGRARSLTRRSSTRATRSCASRAPPSAAPTCTSTTASSRR